ADAFDSARAPEGHDTDWGDTAAPSARTGIDARGTTRVGDPNRRRPPVEDPKSPRLPSIPEIAPAGPDASALRAARGGGTVGGFVQHPSRATAGSCAPWMEDPARARCPNGHPRAENPCPPPPRLRPGFRRPTVGAQPRRRESLQRKIPPSDRVPSIR